MVKVKDVLGLLDERPVISISLLMEELDLSEEQASRVMLILWQKGKVVPYEKSYFGLPPEEGVVLKFRPGATAGGTVSNSWYRPYMDKLIELIRENPEDGVTVNDAMGMLEVSRGVARGTLARLAQQGDLVSKVSDYGGAFGKRPVIWGVDLDAVAKRETILKKKSKANKKKSVKKATQTRLKNKADTFIGADGREYRFEATPVRVDLDDE